MKEVHLLKLAGLKTPLYSVTICERKWRCYKISAWHVFWHWLSPQKHTPAYPGAPFPLKYESYFCSLLSTPLRLKWILYITIKCHHFTIFLWPLQCSSGSRDSSSGFLRISLTWKKINKKTHNSFSAMKKHESLHCQPAVFGPLLLGRAREGDQYWDAPGCADML